MRYKHRDGESATGAVSLTAVRDTVPVQADGTFVVDETREDFDDVHEALVDAGHTPVDETADTGGESDQDADGGEGESDSEDGDDADPLAELTETDIVEELGYRDKQSLAGHYDDIDGSASDDALTEALIEKLRQEQEAE